MPAAVASTRRPRPSGATEHKERPDAPTFFDDHPGGLTVGSLAETTLLSLDGQVRDPMRFAMPYFDADAQSDAIDLLEAHDAMIFGRATFEILGAAWANQSREFADRLNAIPKYVVSSTLTQANWSNSTIVGGDLVKQVEALKDHHPRGLVIYGHGRLSRTLLAHGLIDTVRFNLHPVVVGGEAEPLQQDTSDFQLVSARTRDSGVVVLDYLTKSETR
jgi:dihydrofolate reductase